MNRMRQRKQTIKSMLLVDVAGKRESRASSAVSKMKTEAATVFVGIPLAGD